jgi:hypothetical protein
VATDNQMNLKLRKTNIAMVISIITLLIAVILLGIYFNNQISTIKDRDKIKLTAYEGQMIKIPNCTYATMAINFPVDSGVLYDCVAKVSYVAMNGTTLHITKELGMLTINTNHAGFYIQLDDYPVSTTFMVNFSNDNTLPLVNIEAYGYTKPNISL